MKNNEIVKALRATESRSKRELLDAAADLIEKLTDRCARYAEEIAVAQERTRWIPVTERLPEEGVPVLITYIGTDGEIYADGVAVWADYGCFWWEGSLADCDKEVAVQITHWMPLPNRLRRWSELLFVRLQFLPL